MELMGFELLDIVEHYAAAKRRDNRFVPSSIANRNLNRILGIGGIYAAWLIHGHVTKYDRPLYKLRVKITDMTMTHITVELVDDAVFSPEGEYDEVVIPAETSFRCEPRHIGAPT